VQLGSCLVKSHQPLLGEDYLVYAVTQLERAVTADALVKTDGDSIVSLLLGERQPLSRQQRDRVLRRQISYLADDLVIPIWNAAFVYDTEAGVQAALEIFEFANSQLLQFRYYDDLLDSELGRIYDSLEDPRWYHSLAGQRYVRAAQQLHALFIERWKQNVEEKLDTLDDIYRFTVDQTQMSRGHLLELVIILILVLELVLFFMGIMK
jgi:hypothetical protein